jgi:uncharacterized protein
MRLRAIIVALAFAVVGTAALAQSLTFPELTGRVVDGAGILDAATREQLEKLSADLEAKTTDQLVVVTLKSLQGTSIEDYGYQLGRKWQIGQKDKNISSVIIQSSILPRFRAGDFAGGVRRCAEDIVQVLSGDAKEFQERATQRQASARGLSTGELLILAFWIFVAIMIITNVIADMRGRRGGIRSGQVRRTRDWTGPVIVGGSNSGGWGGGGSSGGSWGGGGGSFGGGGSSGSW